MSFVVEGQPYRLEEQEERVDQYGNTVKELRFAVLHPDLPVPGEKDWIESFVCANGVAEKIRKAAKEQTPIRFECRQFLKPKRDGGKWLLSVCVRVME